MNAGDLTTLANVKTWLGLTVTTSDALLSRLITSNSSYIQAWLNRRIALQAYTERRDGSGAGEGQFKMMFAKTPVEDVSYVGVNGIEIPASGDGGVLLPGYGFDANAVWLAETQAAGGFVRGRRNVTLIYRAGFVIDEERTTPATPFQITPALLWLSDEGVTLDGDAMTKVSSSPAIGQYAVSSTGVYTFNALNTAASVTIRYSYVPADIEQVCIELLALGFAGKDRTGVSSKAVGGETISYLQKDMTSNMKTLLYQYRNVLPL